MSKHIPARRWLSATLIATGVWALCVTSSSARDRATVRDEIVQAIKGSDSPASFKEALKEVSEASPQQLTEGKILYLLFRDQDINFMAEVAPEIQKALQQWNPNEALMLTHKEQVEATLHYFAAYRAFRSGDEAVAKTSALEAVWLDPKMSKYTEFIAEINPPNVTVPMNVTLRTSDGGTKDLAGFVQGKKALYVQIWSTWCGPCLHLFPALRYRSSHLPQQGVPVVALNSELGRDNIQGGNTTKAKHLQKERQMNLPWLIEPQDTPYTTPLDIDSVPRAVLLDPRGKVLFNGHPMDDKLTVALTKLGVQLDLNGGMETASTGD